MLTAATGEAVPRDQLGVEKPLLTPVVTGESHCQAAVSSCPMSILESFVRAPQRNAWQEGMRTGSNSPRVSATRPHKEG